MVHMVLQRVAEIEGKHHNQPWTTSDVIGFFTYSRFVLGNLNDDLNALPDSERRKIEQQLGINRTDDGGVMGGVWSVDTATRTLTGAYTQQPFDQLILELLGKL